MHWPGRTHGLPYREPTRVNPSHLPHAGLCVGAVAGAVWPVHLVPTITHDTRRARRRRWGAAHRRQAKGSASPPVIPLHNCAVVEVDLQGVAILPGGEVAVRASSSS